MAGTSLRLNVMKSHAVRMGRSHSKAVSGVELKYLGWYILSANVFRISLHHMRFAFSSVLTLCMPKAIISVNLFYSTF